MKTLAGKLSAKVKFRKIDPSRTNLAFFLLLFAAMVTANDDVAELLKKFKGSETFETRVLPIGRNFFSNLTFPRGMFACPRPCGDFSMHPSFFSARKGTATKLRTLQD
jgi:hypothetical protein